VCVCVCVCSSGLFDLYATYRHSGDKIQ
jgi:hypothetical protein